MDVWVSSERKKCAELRELLELEVVSLVIRKVGLGWFGHIERRDDTN